MRKARQGAAPGGGASGRIGQGGADGSGGGAGGRQEEAGGRRRQTAYRLQSAEAQEK